MDWFSRVARLTQEVSMKILREKKTNDNIFNRFCYRYKHKQEYCWKDVTLYFLIDFVLFNEYLIYRLLKYLDNR